MSVKEGTIESKPFTSKNLKLMGLDAAAKEEQDDGKKKKKQKVSHAPSVEEEMMEALRRETKTKLRNDPSLSPEKGEKVPEKVKGKSKMTEKDQSQEEKQEIEPEKTAKSTSDEERTISDHQSDSGHSTSVGKMAPLSKVYSRGPRTVWKAPQNGETSGLVESFNKAAAEIEMITPEKEAGCENSEGGTEVLHLDSSGGKGSDATVILESTIPFNLNDEFTVDPSQVGTIAEGIAIEEKEIVEKEASVEKEEEAEKEESLVAEKSGEQGAEKNAEEETDQEKVFHDGIALTQANPPSPQGEFIRNTPSPNIHTPLPPMFPDQMPTLPPFSPSLNLPNTQASLHPVTTAPPTEPSPIPTISRVTSHNLESLIAAINLEYNISPLKTSNTITSSNLNQFLNLNQTPQNDSPQPIYPPFIPQTLPSDIPSHFGSLDSTFLKAALGEPSGTAPEKGDDISNETSAGPSASVEKRMTKMEKVMKRMKGLLKNVLQGQAILQQAQRAQAARDEQFRNWIMQQGNTNPAPNVLPPEFGPILQFPDIPRPATSSSSDGSSPSK